MVFTIYEIKKNAKLIFWYLRMENLGLSLKSKHRIMEAFQNRYSITKNSFAEPGRETMRDPLSSPSVDWESMVRSSSSRSSPCFARSFTSVLCLRDGETMAARK